MTSSRLFLRPKTVGAACLAVGLGFALLAQNAGALSKSHASAPRRGGTLTVVEVSSNTIGIDPAGPTNTAGNYEFYPVFEPLFVTVQGHLRPWLASHYVASNGGTRITLYLNKGINFSDGTQFNASAVQFNFDRYASKTQNSECVPFFAYYTNSVPINRYTLQVNFSRPDPAFLSAISVSNCGLMASPTAVQQQGANFGYHPVGTGPFILQSYGLTSADYVRNPHYWRKGYPLLNRINFLLVSSNTAAVAAVQSGEAQLYLNAQPNDVVSARQAHLKTLEVNDEVDSVDVGFNLGAAPFNNLAARQAIAYAVDPTQFISEFGDGLYSKSQSLIGQGSFAYQPTVPGYPTHNAAKAAAAVKAAGGSLNFSLIYTNTPILQQEAAVFQAQMATYGITVTLEPQQVSTFVQNLHQHTYQAWLSPLASPVPPNDPDLLVYRYLYSTSNLNIDQLNDPVMNTLIQESESSFNTTVRVKYYKLINEQLSKDLPWVYLFNETFWDVTNHQLQNFTPSLAFPDFWQTWLS